MRRIVQLWAWVADNPEDGEEGIVSSIIPADMLVFSPLVTGREFNLVKFREAAQMAANATGKTLRLIRADVTTVCDTVSPIAAPPPKEP